MNLKHRSIRRQSSRTDNLRYLMMMAAACLILLFAVLSAKAEELSNKYCPVTTSELAEEQFSVDYQDQRIYFCCNKCKKDFLSNPEIYLANFESTGTDKDKSESSHDHGEDGHGHGENIEKAVTADEKSDSGLTHDHNTDHDESSSLVGLAGKFHPMVTHFPIALVLAALLFSILAGVLKNQTMNYVSVYSIYLAAVTGIGTVILGLAAGSAANYPSFLSEFLSWHRLFGIATGIVTIVSAYAGGRLLRRCSNGTIWTYRILLIVNGILVGVTGHLGAMLVFGPDYFSL